MEKLDGESEIYKGLMLDWQTPLSPKLDQANFMFGVKGLFFVKDQGEVEPSVTPPVLPSHDEQSKSKFQINISNYLVDSLFDSFLKVYNVSYWTKSKDVPSSFPIKLDTSSLDMFFPGLESHYGKNLPVDIEYKLSKLSDFQVKEADQSLGLSSDIDTTFWVETSNTTREAAVVITLSKLDAKVSLTVEDDTQLKVKAQQLKLKEILVKSTTFGDLNMTKVTKLVDTIFDDGLIVLNAWLETQVISVPTSLFGLFTLSDLTLVYHNDYIEAGLTPTFTPPKNVEGVYEKFVPLEVVKNEFDNDQYIFEETIDELDNYVSNILREYTLAEIFQNQVEIFKQIPMILQK
uniref:Lipid-binding serum glycoprotein C-terminal domain-containing protein n=1 Tax=Strombidium rassoulzadegani TaxID=1082188 RepID=A0A7S3FUF0_9SPIT|mmetsp:Transcript_1924/g.3332  ORF Transcript_1924/g.3332 Transcript_1924/m.3332 type:complete len:347 (+) Transcript_1924:677-1717(+)